MSNYRTAAAACGHPALSELALAAEEASLEHRRLKGEAARILRRLESARQADAASAADAIEKGRPIPEPSEVALRREADEVGRQLAAGDEVRRRTFVRLRTALVGDIGDEVIASSEARLPDLVARVREVLGELALAMADLDDAERAVRWVEQVRRHVENVDGDSIPLMDAAERQVPIQGAYSFPIGTLVDYIAASLPTGGRITTDAEPPAPAPTELELIESGHMYGGPSAA